MIDVYREKVPAQKNLIDFGTYVAMFPQLVAGPIVRYSDVAEQLNERQHSLQKFGEGSARFIGGLAKKVLLANNIGILFQTVSSMNPSERSVLTAWLGAVAYMMQIYFDFSGYSDMAVGLGKMFGFEFTKNFDYPYVSKSVTEFWRRWHISLGSWFREYVYIPLGGNRVTKWKCIRNIFAVWMLTGFWHGADWNFIAWGFYYGVILMAEKYLLRPVLERLSGFIRHTYTLFLVLIGWVLFFSPSLKSAADYIANMFGVGKTVLWDAAGLYYMAENIRLFLLAVLCATPFIFSRFKNFVLERGGFRIVAAVLVYAALMLLVTAYLVNATYNPFLYFRF